MKAAESSLMNLIKNPVQFVIPIYQRAYNWTSKEIEQFWKDILTTGSEDSIKDHFFGSIVYVSDARPITLINPLLLIDGQQRLTTVMLLLSAIRNYLSKNNNSAITDAATINNYYLLNGLQKGEAKYKVILNENDKKTLFNIAEDKEAMEGDSKRLRENYNFFLTKINEKNIERICKGIFKLTIIDVCLDKEKDDPQLIFESLNSTGLELAQADLIRNYVLMGLDKQEQDAIYNDYWAPMEKSFGAYNYSLRFDQFMRDYLTIKTGEIPKIEDVYSCFKTYAQQFGNVKEYIPDIYKYSKYFANISLDKEPDKEIWTIFSDINALKVDVAYPLLLEIYNDYALEKISKEDLVQILKTLESYVLRRNICDVRNNSLNKTFTTLYREIVPENYLESFTAALMLKDSYRVFPKDEEFRTSLLTKDVYNFRTRNYLLKKLENYDRKESVNIDGYTIEHIMPQNENLLPAWQQDLGENWKEIQTRRLHTIGNLTLTGYNSELSDKPFLDKRDIKGGFKDSPIRLNRYLASLEHWNEEEIVKRAGIISDWAIKIWSYPILTEEILEKYKLSAKKGIKDIYTLDHYEPLKKRGPLYSLFEELRTRIMNLDASVKEDYLKMYIAYKTITNFVDIDPKNDKLKLVLNMKFSDIEDPKELCQDFTNKGKLGNGDVEICISSFEELDYAMFLIKQAFNYVSEDK